MTKQKQTTARTIDKQRLAKALQRALQVADRQNYQRIAELTDQFYRQ